jgi:hypothetical protein
MVPLVMASPEVDLLELVDEVVTRPCSPAPKNVPVARFSHRDEDRCLAFVRVEWIAA